MFCDEELVCDKGPSFVCYVVRYLGAFSGKGLLCVL